MDPWRPLTVLIAATLLLEVFVPLVEQVAIFIIELNMQLLQSPSLLDPHEPSQIQQTIVFEDVNHHLAPFTVDAVIVVVLLDLVNWRQLWLQVKWDLE